MLVRVLFIAGLTLCTVASGYAAQLQSLEFADDQRGFTWIAVSLDERVRYKTLLLDNPPRVVIDLADTVNTQPEFPIASERIKKIRHAVRDRTDYRLVFDLVKNESFRHGYVDDPEALPRLMILVGEQEKLAAADSLFELLPDAVSEPPSAVTPPLRDVIVMIDPGHGGKDPGAVAKSGDQEVLEKDIVLEVAKLLQEHLNRIPGIQSRLTRNDDEFIALRERIRTAQEHNADLFLSLHADAIKQKNVKGLAVYVLSDNAATSEMARWLADTHSKSQPVAGVDLKDKDEEVVSIIADLSQIATLNSGVDFAKILIKNLKGNVKMRTQRVEAADFAVLKSLDVPSALVELGYLSNPQEAQRLQKAKYQKDLANLLAKGITRYLTEHPVPDRAFPSP